MIQCDTEDADAARCLRPLSACTIYRYLPDEGHGHRAVKLASQLVISFLFVVAGTPVVFGQGWPATFLGWSSRSDGGSTGAADIQMMRARVTITAPATYYEIMGWNAGGAGGGYLGIQDASTGGGSCGTGPSSGRNYIFSLWDAPSGTPSYVVYSNPTGSTCRFSGEGTGVHYLNYAMPWQSGTWYQFVVKAWTYNSETYFGFWSFDENAGVWTHHATLGYPAPNVFINAYGAFLEYFGPSGDPISGQERRAEYNYNWARSPLKAWIPLSYAQFTTNPTNPGAAQNAYDAGVQNGAYFMHVGDGTVPTVHNGTILSLPITSTAPALTVGRTLSASASYSLATGQLTVSWTPDQASSPQFAYKVDVFDNPTWTGTPVFSQADVSPHVRSIRAKAPLTGSPYFARVTTTDIFDQPAAAVGAPVSMLTVDPVSMAFNATAGASAPASRNLVVSAPVPTHFTVSAAEQSCANYNWLAFAPSGSVTTSQVNTNIVVSVNPVGITGGTTCNGNISVTAAGTSQTVNVTMAVAAQVIYSSFGTNQSFSSGGSCVSGPNNSACGPSVTRWIAGSFTPSGTFSLSSVAIAIGNFGGTNGAVIVLTSSTAAGMPAMTVIERWTLSPLPSSQAPTPTISSVVSKLTPILYSGQTYWVIAEGLADDSMDWWFSNNLGLAGGMSSVNQGNWVPTAQPAFAVLGSPAGSVPLISANGVVNAATLQPAGIAPNEFISIFGSGLGPLTGVAGSMSTLLAGTKVLINGVAAQLTYTQDAQVNAIVPWGVTGTALVQVEHNGAQGNTVTAMVVDSSPGIFTQSYGPGQAWVVNQDGTFNSAANPASRDTVITFWATGQGLVDVQQQDGSQPTGPPFPTPLLPVTVTLGGMKVPDENIVFKGLVFSGEIQINVRIPDTAPTGNSVPTAHEGVDDAPS